MVPSVQEIGTTQLKTYSEGTSQWPVWDKRCLICAFNKCFGLWVGREMGLAEWNRMVYTGIYFIDGFKLYNYHTGQITMLLTHLGPRFIFYYCTSSRKKFLSLIFWPLRRWVTSQYTMAHEDSLHDLWRVQESFLKWRVLVVCKWAGSSHLNPAEWAGYCSFCLSDGKQIWWLQRTGIQ